MSLISSRPNFSAQFFPHWSSVPEKLQMDSVCFLNFSEFTRFTRLNQSYLKFAQDFFQNKELATQFLSGQPIRIFFKLTFNLALHTSKIYQNALLADLVEKALHEKKIIRAYGRIRNEEGPWTIQNCAYLLQEGYDVQPDTPFIKIAMADDFKAVIHNKLWSNEVQNQSQPFPFNPPIFFSVNSLLPLQTCAKFSFNYKSHRIELTLVNEISEQTKAKIRTATYSSLGFSTSPNRIKLREVWARQCANFYLDDLRKIHKHTGDSPTNNHTES